jgi:hypothetical protein
VLRGSEGSVIYFNARADGTFEVMDVPAGEWEVSIDVGITGGKNLKITETHAVARGTFKMPPVSGEVREEPLDLGKIPLAEKKVLFVGEAFPKIAGKTATGEPVSVADFHGRVLLVQVGPVSFLQNRGEIDWEYALHARFAGHPAFAMLTVMDKQAPSSDASLADAPMPWPVMLLDGQRLPQETHASP